jgi:hypothetical protein
MANPILDEISRLSPEAQQALKLAGTNAAAVAPPPISEAGIKPAMLTPPKAGPAPLMAPGKIPTGIQAEAAKMPSVAAPKLSMPAPAAPEMAASLAPPKPAPGTLEANQAERDRLIGSGSGISQVKNPILRGLGRTGEFLGTVATNLIPGMHGAMSVVPGTEQHHNLLVSRENKDIAQQEGERHSQAQIEQEHAKAGADTARAEAERAAIAQMGQPKPKEEQWEVLPEYQGPNGEPVEHEKNSGQVRIAGGDVIPGITRVDKTKQQPPHITYDAGIPVSVTAGNKVYDVNDPNLPEELKPLVQSATRAHRQHETEADARSEKAAERQAEAQARAFAHADNKPTKPNADEQKRADLVENLNENLDQLEDIVKRRPDLFGPMAGRMTGLKGAIGTDDPDIAALKGIEDRLGMVQQSSHGMRSAQHVEQSAQSVLNGFKNSPDAMLRAIGDARKSGATFTADVERKGGPSAESWTPPADAPAAPKEDGHQLKSDGKVIAVSKGGKWARP